MTIYVIANCKGGTGKTAIALNLIPHIQPALIIDADVHKSITFLLETANSPIELRQAKSKEDILKWCAEDKTTMIDCGGFDSAITRYAISQADFIITPTSDDPTEQFGLVVFNDVLKEISKMVDCHLIANVILNKVHHSRTDFSDFEETLKVLEHTNLLDIVIPHTAAIPKAAFKGQAVKNGNLPIKFKKVIEYLI